MSGTCYIADMSANLALRAGHAPIPGMVRRGRLAVRLARLYLGLAAFGVSLALMVRARLGLGPWDVLHQGIAHHLGAVSYTHLTLPTN